MPGSVTVSMGPIATAMGEIYQYTLEGPPMPADPEARRRHLADLRTIQEWVITPLLKSVPGVNEVNSFGGYFKQYQVLVDPAKLIAYRLTLDDVYGAIEKNNENAGGNVLDRFDEQYIVRGVGLLKTEDDIGNVVLAARGGTPVFVRDVAGVQAGEAVRQGAALRNIRGTAGLVVERIGGQPYLTINVDRGQIARHGVNVGDVLRIIEISVGGKAATKFYADNRAFDVAVRHPAEYRSSVETIGNTLVPTRDGYNVPLSRLVQIEVVQGPVQVSRENGLRRIGVEVSMHDRDIGGYVAEARDAIRRKVGLPAGYYTTWGGQFENQQRAMARLMIIAPLTAGLILLLLFITFHSVRADVDIADLGHLAGSVPLDRARIGYH